MRLIKIADLTTGMVLGRKVVSREGISLLRKDTYLTRKYINKLVRWGVESIYISDCVDAKAKFIEQYEEVIKAVKQMFENIRQSGQIPITEIHELTDKMIKPLTNITGVLDYLYEVKLHSDYTFQHSVHVAVITAIFVNIG